MSAAERVDPAAAQQTWWLEDFAEGQVFSSQARTIIDADVAWFAGWSWDTNPVHTDAVGTAGNRFGGPIAHGMLGLSVAMGLVSRIGVFEGCSVALLGIEDWRFLAPLRAGDTVRADVHITQVRRTSSGAEGVLGRRLRLLSLEPRSNSDAGRTAGSETVLQEGNIGLLVAARPEGAR